MALDFGIEAVCGGVCLSRQGGDQGQDRPPWTAGPSLSVERAVGGGELPAVLQRRSQRWTLLCSGSLPLLGASPARCGLALLIGSHAWGEEDMCH